MLLSNEECSKLCSVISENFTNKVDFENFLNQLNEKIELKVDFSNYHKIGSNKIKYDKPDGKIKILIFEAPHADLNLGQEYDSIVSSIKSLNDGNSFEIFRERVTTADEISQQITNKKPHIVHLCGHGLEDGSFSLGKENVTPKFLKSLFQFHTNLKCVIFNTCHSEKVAEKISPYIDYVISMNNSIPDTGAIKFAKSFYRGLVNGYSDDIDVFLRGFCEGIIALTNDDYCQESIPFLKIGYQQAILNFIKKLDTENRIIDFLKALRPHLSTNKFFVQFAEELEEEWEKSTEEINIVLQTFDKELINMSLSGQQRKELQDALINAFPTTAALEQMLSFELDKNLRAIAGEGSLQDIVFQLIQAAESQGWIERLIRAARNLNSGNQLLKEIATKLLTNNRTEQQRQLNEKPGIAPTEDGTISSSISCVSKLGQLTERELHLSSFQTATLSATEKMIKFDGAKAKICYTRSSGNLDYKEYIIDCTHNTEKIKLLNFIVEAKFYNPYNGADDSWKYGFSFRETTHVLEDSQRLSYTLFISSIDNILIFDGPEYRVEEQISNLDVSRNGSNTIHTIVYEDIAIVFVNNIYIKTFDVSGLMVSGRVFLVSTGIGNKSAKYENFKVWNLLGSGEPPTNPAITATPAPLPKPLTQPMPQKILILAAIPHGLRLDQEIRSIEEAIERATNRDLFEIKIKTAVRPADIRRAIGEQQPSIVHFCGHGEEDGSLLLEDNGGNNKPLSPSGLASLFKLHSDYVKCVLLNACHSEKPAAAISQYIDYAIGMNNSIRDDAAIEFAKGFYDGLGYKNSSGRDVFQRAFDEGMVAIEMENLLQGPIPVLKKRQD